MHCSSCGNEVKKNLNYCNACGARVLDPSEIKKDSRFEHVTTAIGFIGVAGIIGFIFLVRMFLANNVDEPVMIVVSLAFLATIFGISFLLIKQLSGGSKKIENNAEFQNDVPKSIKPATTNQLEEPKQAPASVVENTTRTLDKVPIERK